VRPDGRAAVTHYEVLAKYPGEDGAPAASLLACRLMTGRTHQIRVHLAAIGHPLLGDETYGKGFRTKASRLPPEARPVLAGLGRQALHAYLLGISHPTRGEYLEFRSELPDDLRCLRHSLGIHRETA
jgi:23S rRNA pseudouridine1911/1915/1917 synthase